MRAAGPRRRMPGEAEEQPQQQCLRIAVHAQQPGGREGGDDDDLGEDAGALRRPAIGQQAEQEAQYGAGEDRRGDHHRALLGAQLQVAGNLHPQRAEHVPDHEAQVEIEKRREQGRRMAGLPEAVVHRTPRIQRNRGGTAARRKLHRYKVSVRQRTTHPPRRWANDERHGPLPGRRGRATSLSGMGNRRWLPSGRT